MHEHLTLKNSIGLAVVVLVIISAITWYGVQKPEEVDLSSLEDTPTVDYSAPSANPYESAPEVNPVERANPYTDLKTNPF